MSVERNLKAFGVAQVIVTLKGVAPGNTRALEAARELDEVCGHFTRSSESHSGALALASHKKPPRPCKVYKNLALLFGTVEPDGYEALREHEAVKAIDEAPEISLIRPVKRVLAAEPPEKTWGIRRLRVDELWDRGFTGEGVIVGHLDTGVDGSHPALEGAIASFAEFDDFGERVPGAKAHDSFDHGTHTAGTIAGRAVEDRQFGVAPGAKLASAMVIEGGNVVARILGGMDWIIGEGAKVLSMSLGLRGFHDAFLPLMQAVRNRGILPVIAVGNEGPGTSRSPGNYDLVLSVGASDEKERVASFSSSQKIVRPIDPLVPDVVAPGVDVLSSLPDGEFGLFSGSSMATPHVAGLAALLRQARPRATVNEIEAAILESCTRPATMPESRANRGVPDAVKALELLQASVPESRRVKKKTARKTRKTSRKRSR
jgi:subtilisin family serine protease